MKEFLTNMPRMRAETSGKDKAGEWRTLLAELRKLHFDVEKAEGESGFASMPGVCVCFCHIYLDLSFCRILTLKSSLTTLRTTFVTLLLM